MKIEKLMKKYGAPGASIALVQNYKLQRLETYGYADKEDKKKVTKNTLFQAASLSKPITALLVLKLVEKKTLNLNKDVNHYLKDWKVRDKKGKEKKITLKQILSHTAGLSCSGFPGYNQGKKIPNILQVLEGKGNTEKVFVKKKPGKYSYSGGGYVILQKIIEDVTNKKFEDLMEKEIFKPLNLKSTGFNKKGLASGYNRNGRKISGGHRIYLEGPAGLLSTPEDLAKFMIEIQKTKKILSKTSTKKMLKPITKAEKPWSIGLGIFTMNIGKNKLFFHTGHNYGFKSTFIGSLNGKGLIIMTNSDSNLSDKILRGSKWQELAKRS